MSYTVGLPTIVSQSDDKKHHDFWKLSGGFLDEWNRTLWTMLGQILADKLFSYHALERPWTSVCGARALSTLYDIRCTTPSQDATRLQGGSETA
jgi:hypothetical protein